MKRIVSLIISPFLLASGLLFSLNKEKAQEVKADDYYASISSTMKGDVLKEALYKIIKGHTQYSYNSLEVAMKYTDRNWDLSPDKDDENPYMVLLYAEYNQTNPQKWNTSQGSYGVTSGYIWNKEHIWAKSNGFNQKGCMAYSDLHHLRASDWKLNNTRSNYPFGNASNGKASEDAFGKTTGSKLGGGVFEPIDQYKGDVARALFYMATRYYNGDGSTGTKLTLTTGTDSSGGKWGYLDTLLAWHELDPVDEWELNRNSLVQELQNNRNPYIDHPEYARAVFKNEPIVVNTKTLSSLSVTGTPEKTEYTVGEQFNPNGLKVTATYSDNSTMNVISSVTWTPNPLTLNTTSVTGSYTYEGVTKTVTIDGLSVKEVEEPEPINPVDPVEPVDPEEPQDPVEPTEPTEPVEDDLEAYKENAIANLRDYYNNFDLSKYATTNRDVLLEALNNGVARIRASTSKEEVDSALQSAKTIMDAVQVVANVQVSKGCVGTISTTSVLLSALALLGFILIIVKKSKKVL